MKKFRITPFSETAEISVSVDQETYVKLGGSADADAAAEIAKKLENAARQLAEGAVLISPESARRLAELGVGDEAAIVEHVERAVGRRGARYVYEVVLDPSLAKPLESIARFRNTTVDRIMTDVINYGVHMGWIYRVPGGRQTVVFSDEQMSELAQLLGLKPQDVNSASILDWIRRRA